MPFRALIDFRALIGNMLNFIPERDINGLNALPGIDCF